jgi:hypothetical protein
LEFSEKPMTQTSSDPNVVMLIGARDAGKSNYLFRLWMAIDEGKGRLKKSAIPEDIEHLRAGADRLLNGHFAERTAPDVHVRVEIPVRHAIEERFGTLVVPDVAGEQVLAVCQTREWSSEWEQLVSEKAACLVFVRAGSDEIVAPLDWVTYQERFGGVPDQPAGIVVDGAIEPLEMPTQIVLIEWLQFLRIAFTSKIGGGFVPRVGIVISAWDAVPLDQQNDGPEDYVRQNFPMLHQFLRANDARFEVQYFGTSVVDGDLTNDSAFRQKFLEGNPADFGYIVHALDGPHSKSSDVTIPIAWALRF